MGGSILLLSQNNKANSHANLDNRSDLYQHPLKSIYRESDGETLENIITGLQEKERAIIYDLVEIDSEATIVNFPKLRYNVTKDVLLVFCGGAYMYEGTDKDYVKLSESSIEFNFTLKPEMHVLAILGGSLSGESYGDSIDSGLSRFTQLTDTFNSYHGNENKFLMVNESGTGIVPVSVKASHNLESVAFKDVISTDYQITVPFPSKCYITGIKATSIDSEDVDFEFQILDQENIFIYSSGIINGVLWDIMKIPCIQPNEQITIKILNSGKVCEFNIQIYYER